MAKRSRFLPLILPLAALLSPAAASADAGSASQAGTAGAVFLQTEQGARGTGMGGAFTSIVDDGSALWWNPAGLAREQNMEVTFNHTAMIDNVANEYVGLVKPIAPLNGSVGASFTYLNVPSIQGADSLGNPTANIKANSYAGALSFGMFVSSAVTVGATGKFISQTLDTTNGSGIAADIGGQYRVGRLGLGLVAQNLGPAFKMGSTTSPLPRSIRGGASWNVLRNLVFAVEEESSIDANPRFHFGGEWHPIQLISVRGGFQQTPNVGSGAGVTFGLGLSGLFGGGSTSLWNGEFSSNFWDQHRDVSDALRKGAYLVGLDYAFVSNGQLSDLHRVSIYVRF